MGWRAELTADFQRFYGATPWTLADRGVPARDIAAMAIHLPVGSAVLRALDSEGRLQWTVTDYLLATVVDLLAGANWQRSGGKGSRPKPIPRPVAPLHDDDDDVEAIAIDGFESIDAFDTWYRTQFTRGADGD